LLEPSWLPVSIDLDFLFVLRIVIKLTQRNLISIQLNLRETRVVSVLLFFYEDLELARFSHLENMAVIYDCGEHLARDFVIALSVARIQPWTVNIQNISEQIGFHFSQIKIRILLKTALGNRDDEG